MNALTKDCTAEQRADLAIEIAQHAHLKACDLCALALAEISGDVTQPWSRQTLNALAHRCQESERNTELADRFDAMLRDQERTPDADKNGDE